MSGIFEGVLISDDQLRITALDQALRFHDTLTHMPAPNADEVVKTAQKFFDFLAKD